MFKIIVSIIISFALSISAVAGIHTANISNSTNEDLCFIYPFSYEW